jgi:hypothetical protein
VDGAFTHPRTPVLVRVGVLVERRVDVAAEPRGVPVLIADAGDQQVVGQCVLLAQVCERGQREAGREVACRTEDHQSCVQISHVWTPSGASGVCDARSGRSKRVTAMDDR